MFIDCDNSFAAQRLTQIALEKSEEIAQMIILMKPKDFQEQAAVVDGLTDYVASNFGLVVFDTITSLYRLRVAEQPEKTFELNRELNRQLASLAQFAKTRKVTVLLVSQVRTAFEEGHVSIEPVATRVLRFWSDIIINMKLTENPQVVKAVLERTPRKLQPKTCQLKIGKCGIHDCVTR